MNQRLWQRLADAEQHLEFATRQVVVIRRHEKETDSEFDAKIERWQAGELVDGIDAKYEGGEVSFVGVVGATARNVDSA